MGIFKSILEKYKNAKQKSLNKKEFRNILIKAASDGKITKEELKKAVDMAHKSCVKIG